MAKYSFVDALAERLGQKIGATVKVVRLLDPDKDSIGRVKVGRYQILIIRNGQAFLSGDMRVDEAERFLALVSSWIGLGFVKLAVDPARREELTSPPRDGMVQGQGDIK